MKPKIFSLHVPIDIVCLKFGKQHKYSNFDREKPKVDEDKIIKKQSFPYMDLFQQYAGIKIAIGFACVFILIDRTHFF